MFCICSLYDFYICIMQCKCNALLCAMQERERKHNFTCTVRYRAYRLHLIYYMYYIYNYECEYKCKKERSFCCHWNWARPPSLSAQTATLGHQPFSLLVFHLCVCQVKALPLQYTVSQLRGWRVLERQNNILHYLSFSRSMVNDWTVVRNQRSVQRLPHCKDTVPKIRNKYSNPRNETASGLVPNTYIHKSVSDWYITMIGLLILLQQNRWPIVEIYKSLRDTWMWLGTRPRKFIFGT
jgi:hypothetical protein